jgi:hypothetical protein
MNTGIGVRSIIGMRFWLGCGFSLCILCSWLESYIRAQETLEPLLPAGSEILWKLEPAKIVRSEIGSPIPWEALSAVGSDSLGIDFTRLPSIYGSFEWSGPSSRDYAVCFLPSRSIDIVSLNDQLFGPVRSLESKKSVRLRPWKKGNISLVQTPERWMAGTEGSLKLMLKDQRMTHRLGNRLQNSSHPIAIVLDVKQLKGRLGNYLSYLSVNGSSELADLFHEMSERLDVLEIYIGVERHLDLEIRWTCLEDSDVERMAELIEAGWKLFLNYGVGLWNMDAVGNGVESKSALRSYRERLGKSMNLVVNMEKNGNLITTRIERVDELAGLIGLIEFSSVPLATIYQMLPRPKSETNLETLAIALHSYEAVHRRIPARVVKDKSDRPLLSWRVLLLPYIGEEELYSQFHLDEPWDSEHNKKLLQRMPSVYGNPQADLPQGYTTYIAPHGMAERKDQTAWDIEPLMMRQISDGLANTAAIVEVQPQSAVPWTKPEDFDLRERELLDFIGAPPAGGLIVMLDSTCYDFSRWKDKRKFKGLLSVQGGEAVTAPF